MKAKEAEVQAQKAARARVPPQDMFKNRKNPDGEPMYKDFDIDGIPTSNSSGEPVSVVRVRVVVQLLFYADCELLTNYFPIFLSFELRTSEALQKCTEKPTERI